MTIFAAADLQRKSAEIQRAADREPVFITHYDKPRYVLMSMETFARIGAHKVVAAPGSFPESVMARIRELEDAHPEAEPRLVGGLAALLDEADGVGRET